MKIKLLLAAFAATLLFTEMASAQATATVTLSGAFTEAQIRGAKWKLEKVNAELVAAGETPWPIATNAELKASYESYQAQEVIRILDSYAKGAEAEQNKTRKEELRKRFVIASDAERDAAFAAAEAELPELPE